MPQSTAALRQRDTLLRLLRAPSAALPRQVAGKASGLSRPTRARTPFVCAHGTCQALELREGALWVLVRDHASQEAWAPVARVLSPEQRRAWARGGFD